MNKTLAALALGLALATAPIPRVKADTTLSVGLSSPCHGLIALRGVLEGEHVGVQTDIGAVFTSVDFRYKERLSDFVNLYGYAGAIGISPWMYALPGSFEGSVFGLEFGAGFEIGRKKGLSLGIEGGFILPIQSDPNSGVFRADLNLMYRFPLKK
jgi:hypothetical protein